MECLIEASPRPVNYWIRASNTKAGDIISSELYVRPDMLLDGYFYFYLFFVLKKIYFLIYFSYIGKNIKFLKKDYLHMR